MYPGSEVDTAKLEDVLFYVKDLRRKSSDIIAMNYGTRTKKTKAVGCQSGLMKGSTK